MTLISELKEQWIKNPAFKAEYDALEDEFSLARELIEARAVWEIAGGGYMASTGRRSTRT